MQTTNQTCSPVVVWPTADDLTGETRQTTGDILPNGTPVADSEVMGSNEKSTGQITSKEATSVDRELIPKINHPDVQANVSSSSPAHQPDPARVIRPKIPSVRYRTSMRPRLLDVKMRLIALWHQRFARDEKSRGWTLFSNSNKLRRKKISYTAATSH